MFTPRIYDQIWLCVIHVIHTRSAWIFGPLEKAKYSVQSKMQVLVGYMRKGSLIGEYL